MGLGIIGNMYVCTITTRPEHWREQAIELNGIFPRKFPCFRWCDKNIRAASCISSFKPSSSVLCSAHGIVDEVRWVACSFVPRCLPTWFPLLLAGWLPVPEEHGYYIIQMSMYTYNSWPGEENQPLLSDPLWVSFVNLDGGLVRVDVLQYQHHYRRWYTRFPFTWMDGLAGLCDAIYPSIHPSTSRVQ